MRRVALAALLTLAIVVIVSGCSSSRAAEGRSVEEASRLVAAHDGVTGGRVEQRIYKSGFTSRWGVDVYFKPAADELQGDDKMLLRDLLRIGWSVDGHPIDGGVSLILEDTPGLDLAAVAREVDLPPFTANASFPTELTVSSRDMSKAFGPWPGRG